MAWLLVIAACGGSGSSTDKPSPDSHVSTESGPLGMNDVSILLPLPTTAANAVITKMQAPGRDLVPRDLFARLVAAPGDVINTYDEFHVVAIRFDLCDRPTPGACAVGDDGRLRMVFQPIFDSMGKAQAFDVALHAFYPIPNGELGAVADELRALAALDSTPTADPLHVSTAVSNVTYADALRAFVLRYAFDTKLTRLTLFAQNAFTASLNWAFRGEEMKGGQLTPISIPDVSQMQQRTILGNDGTYSTTPVADKPIGFTTAIDSAVFGAASPSTRMQALEAMAAIQNPMLHTAETVQCIGCHVTTFLSARRAVVAGVDPATVANRFTSNFNLATTGKSTSNDRSLRAFGYLFSEPMISQRVVNDTAQVLAEIDARFPPAQ